MGRHAGEAPIANLSKTLPGLRGSHVLNGCGHWVQQERLREVNELLVKFVKGSERADFSRGDHRPLDIPRLARSDRRGDVS